MKMKHTMLMLIVIGQRLKIGPNGRALALIYECYAKP